MRKINKNKNYSNSKMSKQYAGSLQEALSYTRIKRAIRLSIYKNAVKK